MIHGPIEVEMIKFYCLSTPKRNKILRQYSFVFWIFFPRGDCRVPGLLVDVD